MPRFSRRKASARTASSATGHKARPRSSGHEPVVVVFLVFLVVGIEADRFVIPTGSMVPTLVQAGIHDQHGLMFGDNSPWSRDDRVWEMKDEYEPSIPGRRRDRSGRSSWEDPESLLIGKAFSVSRPHMHPVWPQSHLSRDVRLPALPDLCQVRWIR